MDDLNGKAAQVVASASAAPEATGSDVATTVTKGDPGQSDRAVGAAHSSAFSDAGDRLLCGLFILVSCVGMLYLVEMVGTCAGFEVFHAR